VRHRIVGAREFTPLVSSVAGAEPGRAAIKCMEDITTWPR
jgi:hypothetical protein